MKLSPVHLAVANKWRGASPGKSRSFERASPARHAEESGLTRGEPSEIWD